MDLVNQFTQISEKELQQVDGGVAVLALVGYSIAAYGTAGTAGYFLARMFG